MEDEHDPRRERIETFARLIVSAYGFQGYEAEQEREQIVRALNESRDPIDYVGLRQRARRFLEASEIRRVLVEAGLPDHEFEAVLREVSRTSPPLARDRSATTVEPGSQAGGVRLAQAARSAFPPL